MTTTPDLTFASIEDAAALLASRQLSPVELAQAQLERVERLQPQLNAFMVVTAESALEEARAAEREIVAGNYRGPLHGIPIAHKDLFQTKGVQTTMGSGILRGWTPDEDAAVVTMLRDAGAVSLGKLGMHEWAYGTTSDNIHYGAIHNPWNLAHVPGGSSGGTGAAVAAGLIFAGTGSDTGGSIRMPAAACGCVGLMPTYGRVSLYGALPLSWTLDHAGPLARTVRDAAIMLQAIAGHDPRDPTTERVPVPDYLEGIDAGPKGLRIGVPKQLFWDNVEPAAIESVRTAIAAMESAGADVREVDFPQAIKYATTYGPVMFSDAIAYHEQYYPARKSEYSPQVAFLLDLGVQTTGGQMAKSLRVLQTARAGEADAVLDGVDVLAVPSMPTLPPTIEECRGTNVAGRMAAFTSVFDLTGQPALSVPTSVTESGLPASIMFVGRRWDEASMLRAGRAWELVRGPWAPPQVD
jgi:aspartyl-tRNA(Asn)/glutamyl-tRNA(Gln) amidotransferase subunit A